MVCTFLKPLLWEGKDVMNALRESCTAIIMLFTIGLNTILLSRRTLFAALLRGVDHFTPSISIGSITRGRNVVNAYEKL